MSDRNSNTTSNGKSKSKSKSKRNNGHDDNRCNTKSTICFFTLIVWCRRQGCRFRFAIYELRV